VKVKSFLKLVEIQTKLASVTPFTLGTLYAYFRFGKFHFLNFILMFVSLLTFDMTTTAINNYLDYKKAQKKEGFGYEVYNAIVRDNLKESSVLTVIFSLLSIAIVFGILLFLNTNYVILVLGIISFSIGILYTFGPVPISRTPTGEIFSGLTMGFVITFLACYIHVYDQNIVTLAYQNGFLNLSINLPECLYIFLVSVPAVCGIANIMLANNICDIEDDIENKRYTLPIYIGKDNGLKLFRALYLISFVDLVVAVLLGVLPLWSLLVLLTFIPVHKNIKIFFKEQSKKDTFVVAVKNLMIINWALIVTIVPGIIGNLLS